MASSCVAASGATGDAAAHELRQLLQDVQLQQFLPRLRDDLQVTQICHFDYVRGEDLERIGLGKPAARRLLDAVKKRRAAAWRKAVVAKLLPGGGGRASPPNGAGGGKEDGTVALHDVPGGLTSLIQEKDIVSGKRLGDGSFGVVREGDWTTSDGTVRKVAIKVLKVDVVAVAGALEDFMREVAAMTQLSHPNLIRLYGIVLGRPLMMVTELAPLGSLLDYLRSSTPPSITTSSTFVLQVCGAMRYLESRRCIHRDLAARNVFLASEDTAKLGDFGLTRSLSQADDCYIMTEAKKVPFPWCAPESLKAKTFSHASDMWMFGVTVWEVYSRGEEPWAGLNGGQILRKVEAGDRLEKPLACPPPVYSLITESWSMDPSQRPSFAGAYERLVGLVPAVVEARQRCQSEGKLAVEVGDTIAVVDGSAEKFWWVGENIRTGAVGEFPRCIVDTLRPLASDDISSPLQNSFIHTGHGGVDKTWGNPAYIDEMFLRNPMTPPDKAEGGGGRPATMRSGATLPRKLQGQRKTKHQSLRIKPSSRSGLSGGKPFQYNKLPPHQWPDDVSMLAGFGGDDGVLVEVEGGEDGSTGGSLGRHRSYSVSDLRHSLPAASPAPMAPLYDSEGGSRGERGSVSSLNDLPDAQHTYGNVEANDYNGGSSNANTNLLVPVRPSPAPPVKNKVSQRQQQEQSQQHFTSSGGPGHPPTAPNIYSNSFVGDDALVDPSSSYPGAVYGNVMPDDPQQTSVYYNNIPGAAPQPGAPFGGDPQYALYDEPPSDEGYAANDFAQSSYQNIEACAQWPSQPPCPPPPAPTAAPSRDLSADHRQTPSQTHNNESQTSLRNTSGGVASVQSQLATSHDTHESSSSSQRPTSVTPSIKPSNVPSSKRLEMISELNNQLGNMWLSSVGSRSRTQSPVPTLPPPSASPSRSRPTAATASASSGVRGSPVKVLPSANTSMIPASYGANFVSEVSSAVSSPSSSSIASHLGQTASLNCSATNQNFQSRSLSVPGNSANGGRSGSQEQSVQKRLSSLDPSFIQDLEKNLGKDQATANTFSDSFNPCKINETVVAEIHSPPSGISSTFQRPNVGSMNAAPSSVAPQPDVPSSSAAAVLTSASSHLATQRVNPQHAVSQVPAPEQFIQHLNPQHPSSEAAVVGAQSTSVDQTRTVFSDLDVESSSKTLGLQAKPEVDTRKFFPKNTAHVRPILQRTNQNAASSVVPFPYMTANNASAFPTSLPGTRSPYLFAQPDSNTFTSGTGISTNAMSTDLTAGRDLRSEFLVSQSQTSFPDQFVQSQPMRGTFTMGSNPLPSSQTQEVTYNLNNSSGWSNPSTYSLSTSVSSTSGASYNLSTRVTSALASPNPPPPTLTPQEMAEFASPPSSQQQQQLQYFGATGPQQQQQLPLQYQLQLQQIQQQHQQQYGHPLSAQQLKVRLMQIQQQKQQQQELQQQNLQQIQQLRQQQLLQQQQQEHQRLQQHQQQQQQKAVAGGLSAPLQPTVVLSPQVTVNYNQLVCAAGRSDRGAATDGAAEALVSRVAAVVPGATVTEARQALHVAAGNYQGAVQYLKVEKLYRLGLTNKADCEQILEENAWELQRSASALLDKFS